MLGRRELFPHVIEMNYQARRRMGCCVYLVFDGDEWLLIDIGYEDTAREIIDLIRQLDFPLSQCKYLVVTHADADHIQGLKLAQELLPGANDIEVRCDGGRVTLTGSAAHKRVKRDAGEIVWAIPSVNDVQNNITIATRRRSRAQVREAEAGSSTSGRKPA